MSAQGCKPNASEQCYRDEGDLKRTGELRHLPLLRHVGRKVEGRNKPWTAFGSRARPLQRLPLAADRHFMSCRPLLGVSALCALSGVLAGCGVGQPSRKRSSRTAKIDQTRPVRAANSTDAN